jgi:ketosteroid isomerase-like protein
MAAAWRNRLTGGQDVRATVEQYRELDAERVLVLMRTAGRAERSGIDLEEMRMEGAALLHVHNGRVTRLVVYWDRDRALADLGLEE